MGTRLQAKEDKLNKIEEKLSKLEQPKSEKAESTEIPTPEIETTK